MISYYVKQAWELMKQNKLFTGIYVVGTALAVASTMIMAIIYYVKIAPMYPENNRANTYFMVNGRFKSTKQSWMNASMYGYKALQEWFYPLKSAELVSASNDYYSVALKFFVQLEEGRPDQNVTVKFTDPAFFQMYEFKFLEGKPFTQEEFESGQRRVVISDNLARIVFHTAENVVGKTFQMNFVEYQVVGVVHEPSFLMSESYAQLYIPYSIIPNYNQPENNPEYLGSYKVTMLAKDGKALKAEIEELVRKYNNSQEDWQWIVYNQPLSHLTRVFSPYETENFSWLNIMMLYFGVFIALLLVPALNLSGMIAGRMETRLAEMGVRKAFGANRSLLLGQVMWENLILTLVGGCLGLLIAWAALYGFRSSLFNLMDLNYRDVMVVTSTQVDASMFFAPTIFGITLLICLLLNMLSALIPAWNSLRHPIVESLNEKR